MGHLFPVASNLILIRRPYLVVRLLFIIRHIFFVFSLIAKLVDFLLGLAGKLRGRFLHRLGIRLHCLQITRL